MKVRSLTRQIVTIVLLAQILCAIALAGFAVLHEGHTRLRAFDVSLQGRSDSLLGAIQDAEDADSTVRIDPAELKLPVTDVFAVYNQGGKMLGSSAGAPPSLIARGSDEFRTLRTNGIRYRVLQREGLRVIDRAEFGGVGLQRPVTILYASPQTHVWHEIFEAASYSLLAIFFVAAMTMLFVGFFLRKALQPLSELAVAAGAISAPSLHFEPPTSVLQVRELRPLAEVLIASVDRLRDSFEKERRFVGDAAHELKTAIAVVRSSVQVLMLKRRSQEEYEAGLVRVLDDNVRVESLVTQMLDLARVTEAPQADTPPTDLGEAAQQVTKELQLIAEERGVEIFCSTIPGAMVAVPPARARALITNLVVNSLQHSRPGTTVKVSVQRQGLKDVVLQVADSGAGISEAALPHIFDRFYREDQSRSRDTGGTGLGLSICKAIVESAGGSLHATSQLNARTTMTAVFSAA